MTEGVENGRRNRQGDARVRRDSRVKLQVNGNVLLPVHCSVGGPVAGTISVPVSLGSFTIPAGSTSWYRTNDQKSVLGWMGAVQATAICGPSAQMFNTEGARPSTSTLFRARAPAR